MKQLRSIPILVATLSLLLAACAGASAEAVQTGAAETLNAEVTAAVGQAALQTAEAENAALQATNDALATQLAVSPTSESSPTSGNSPTPLATASWTPVPATAAPTNPPGISARFVDTLTCGGVKMAILRVRNVGNETYQSAIVVSSDSSDVQLGRSDGNSEFLPNQNTCPGGEPTLGPGEEAFVAVSIAGATAGDTLTTRVTVCTEKGFGGTCRSSTDSYVP